MGVADVSTTQVGSTPSARVPDFVIVPAAVLVAESTSSANEYTADRAWMVRTAPAAAAQIPEKSLLMKLAKCVAMVSGVSVKITDLEMVVNGWVRSIAVWSDARGAPMSRK